MCCDEFKLHHNSSTYVSGLRGQRDAILKAWSARRKNIPMIHLIIVIFNLGCTKANLFKHIHWVQVHTSILVDIIYYDYLMRLQFDQLQYSLFMDGFFALSALWTRKQNFYGSPTWDNLSSVEVSAMMVADISS